MESIPKNEILEFNPNTLEDVRKEFNLDKPGRVQEGIKILEEWVKKQNHFLKRDFSPSYLEITLITTKGLVERAKTRIDKLCTFKTLMPHFFEDTDLSVDLNVLRNFLSHGHLPKLTRDNYRVYFIKFLSDQFDSSDVFLYYRYLIIKSEYLKMHNYCKGFILILDYTDVNIMNFITKINIVELRQAFTLLTEGYGMRLKGIHIITPSKMIDALVSLFKQVLTEKLSNRIHVHKTLDTLYEHVEKEILPIEYGGNERSLKQLNEDWIQVLSTEEHTKYMKIMNRAKTNESCRSQDKFNENYVGMPGSFRSLSVD